MAIALTFPHTFPKTQESLEQKRYSRHLISQPQAPNPHTALLDSCVLSHFKQGWIFSNIPSSHLYGKPPWWEKFDPGEVHKIWFSIQPLAHAGLNLLLHAHPTVRLTKSDQAHAVPPSPTNSFHKRGPSRWQPPCWTPAKCSLYLGSLYCLLLARPPTLVHLMSCVLHSRPQRTGNESVMHRAQLWGCQNILVWNITENIRLHIFNSSQEENAWNNFENCFSKVI